MAAFDHTGSNEMVFFLRKVVIEGIWAIVHIPRGAWYRSLYRLAPLVPGPALAPTPTLDALAEEGIW